LSISLFRYFPFFKVTLTHKYITSCMYSASDGERWLFVLLILVTNTVRRVWRYQRGNQNPYIEEEQTTQWPKENEQKDKQWSTKHIHKTKDRVTRTPLITMGELRCPGRISSSWSTSGSRRVSLVTNPVISDEWGKCLRQVEHIRGYFLTQIFHSGQLSFHNSIIVWALLLLDRQCCLCNNIFEHFQHDMTM
jgi:hypothetical protein